MRCHVLSHESDTMLPKARQSGIAAGRADYHIISRVQ